MNRFLAVVVVGFALACSNGVLAQGLTFPVKGAWGIFQGPPCPAPDNHHCATPNQRFAYDLVPLGPFGNANPWACMGMPIFSPAPGTVVHAQDGYPNFPMAGQHPAGNHVVIRRSATEYILVAHMAQGSVSVTPGAGVSAGQVIGACGHSGNSSAPHIHIHMQAGPNVLDFNTPGLPMQFSGVIARMPGGPCMPLPPGQLLLRGMMTC